MFFMVVAVAQFALVLLNDKRGSEARRWRSPAWKRRLRRRGNVNLAIRVLAGVGVATSFVGPPGGTGMFFAAVKTRGLWEGGITSVLFYVMAVVTAAAFLIVAYRLLARLRGARPDGARLVGRTACWRRRCSRWRSACSSRWPRRCCRAIRRRRRRGGDGGGFFGAAVLDRRDRPGTVVPAVLLAVGAARCARRMALGRPRAAASRPWRASSRCATCWWWPGFRFRCWRHAPAGVRAQLWARRWWRCSCWDWPWACYGLAVRLLPLERMGASEGEARLEKRVCERARCGRRVVRRGFDGQGGARWKRSIKRTCDAMPQASLSVELVRHAVSARRRRRRCAARAGALVAGGRAGGLYGSDDPLTDEPHGRGNATGAYAADDVILSMCNNCNTLLHHQGARDRRGRRQAGERRRHGARAQDRGQPVLAAQLAALRARALRHAARGSARARRRHGRGVARRTAA